MNLNVFSNRDAQGIHFSFLGNNSLWRVQFPIKNLQVCWRHDFTSKVFFRGVKTDLTV